ncbi:hypothetical protein ACFOED_07075 [Vulcaniibacterium thermophilum]|jgi:hypothetical protein|uniref:Uncharacterized protein n=1 Tax=Vulcaniibacterium thermophilum TaxID=1169913 RepID=A0A918YYV4_9GAMM|nr:hypothetical protein [Vulcaniibacterium thermophilum]GHE29936.1 hypothetical protein GCM10007167_09750 [Vulcaniibacterium thermophilum]
MSGARLLLRREHLPLIRTPLLLALAAVLVAGALAGIARAFAVRAQAAHAQAAQALAGAEAELAQSRQSHDELERNLRRYAELRRTGFVGEGDRIGWTEALLAQQRALGLPPVRFELAPQRAIGVGAAPVVDGIEPDAAAPGPQAHDLRFSLAGIHEDELLALVDGLQARGIGHFRVEDCELRRGSGMGLDADCTLRWITWRPAATAVAAEGAP